MARALVITNPAAARTTHPAVVAIEDALRRRGWSVEVLATGGTGDARRLAAYGVETGVDVVAVFGGDGTVMQAAAALVGTETILGLIPGGTGNLLAGNLRLPRSPIRAAEIIAAGHSRRIDLGQVERPDGLHVFAVAAGAGIDARIMTETATAEKHRWGIGAYLSTMARVLPEIRSIPHVITVDGREFTTDAAMVMVANCGEMIPPFFRIRSDASPEDGLFEVVVVRADSIWDGLRVLGSVLRPNPESRANGDRVTWARGEVVTVAPATTQPVQLDGDSAGVTPFTARIIPRAIRVMLPEA